METTPDAKQEDGAGAVDQSVAETATEEKGDVAEEKEQDGEAAAAAAEEKEDNHDEEAKKPRGRPRGKTSKKNPVGVPSKGSFGAGGRTPPSSPNMYRGGRLEGRRLKSQMKLTTEMLWFMIMSPMWLSAER